jgi:DNA-binding NtrC family response regulator
MALFQPEDWAFSEKVLKLVHTNPFDPSWRKQEAEILGLPLREELPGFAWSPGAQLWGPQSIYSEVVDQQVTQFVEGLRGRLETGAPATVAELERYELLAFYHLYCEFGLEMDQRIATALRGEGKAPGAGRPPQADELWEKFRSKHESLFRFNGRTIPAKYEPKHLFACFFVFRRAFYHIFFNIIGTSKPIAKLRSAVWESIVTCDHLGWKQGQYALMRDIPTLITGPTGTGKERVAEAIGRSLYIPFDKETKAFQIDFHETFKPVNLVALAPLLIESELFGHIKGAFAGAVRDRIGRLEECPEEGALFLDEIGELTHEIQVKLLRVLQERCFQRVGENENKAFRGRIIAATNRDLAAEVQAGRFREDFYFRLCADQITTPSLSEQLRDRPEDLRVMVEFVCRSVVGEEKAKRLAGEVVGWIEKHPRLGRGYAWPGNFRELEQCVRSYTIRKEYHPLRSAGPRADDGATQPLRDPVAEACEALSGAVLGMRTTCADELRKKRIFDQIKRHLFTFVRARTHTKQEAATLLGIDVRTLEAGMSATGRTRDK